MTALTAEELIAWVDHTATRWQALIAAHPEVMFFPCDVLETGTVAGLLQHIVAVELRYAQRLEGTPETPYSDIPTAPAEAIFTLHREAIRKLNAVIANPTILWEDRIEFQTRSMGALAAIRRAVLVHALLHSVRHFAQLATLVRQYGVKPDWPMDYLFMAATRPT